MTTLTIKDIAKMCGVSTTAVSFVLNDRSGVSEATRQKVQEVIRRTGFTPNVHTRRLNLGKSFTIHVVLRRYAYSLYNQFAMETLIGIFRASKPLGYSTLFTLTGDDTDCEQLMESVRNKDCDGVILDQVSDPMFITMLQQEHIPFVCVDAHIKKDNSLPLVEVDYFDAAYQATGFLYRNGHRQIGFIGPESPNEYYVSTFGGYAKALRETGLVCNPAWMVNVSFDEESATACIDQILSKKPLPTAFFCAGDSFAIDVIRCAKLRGIRVPEDLSIMSVDDLLVSRYLDPPLSTMTFDKELLGERAMQLLYQIMNDQPYEMVNLIPTSLVSRSTVHQLL